VLSIENTSKTFCILEHQSIKHQLHHSPLFTHSVSSKYLQSILRFASYYKVLKYFRKTREWSNSIDIKLEHALSSIRANLRVTWMTRRLAVRLHFVHIASAHAWHEPSLRCRRRSFSLSLTLSSSTHTARSSDVSSA